VPTRGPVFREKYPLPFSGLLFYRLCGFFFFFSPLSSNRRSEMFSKINAFGGPLKRRGLFSSGVAFGRFPFLHGKPFLFPLLTSFSTRAFFPLFFHTVLHQKRRFLCAGTWPSLPFLWFPPRPRPDPFFPFFLDGFFFGKTKFFFSRGAAFFFFFPPNVKAASPLFPPARAAYRTRGKMKLLFPFQDGPCSVFFFCFQALPDTFSCPFSFPPSVENGCFFPSKGRAFFFLPQLDTLFPPL